MTTSAGAGERWCSVFAIACNDEGLDRPSRLALISHAIGRPVSSSREVLAEEVAKCWSAFLDLRDWRLEVFYGAAGSPVVRSRPA